MPDVSSLFDFRTPVAYCKSAKREFRLAARRQLSCLAEALGRPPGGYSIHWRKGRMAASGEIFMYTGLVYVHVSQPTTGPDTGVMFRSCEGRNHYRDRPDNFAPLDLLNRPEELADRIREMCRV